MSLYGHITFAIYPHLEGPFDNDFRENAFKLRTTAALAAA